MTSDNTFPPVDDPMPPGGYYGDVRGKSVIVRTFLMESGLGEVESMEVLLRCMWCIAGENGWGKKVVSEMMGTVFATMDGLMDQEKMRLGKVSG